MESQKAFVFPQIPCMTVHRVEGHMQILQELLLLLLILSEKRTDLGEKYADAADKYIIALVNENKTHL